MTTLNEEDSARLLADLENGCSPEEAERRKEYAKRELAKMGLGPAAGPWIRVDSGERPGDGERVIVASVSDDWWGAARYDGPGDMFDDGHELLFAKEWDYWARIRPPEER